MAQPPNYSQIPLSEHRPQPYPSTKVQSDGAGKLSTYHKEDDNKQPPHTLPENQHFIDTESSPAYKEVPSMIHKGDPPPPLTSVEHICVVTDNAPIYDSVSVNVDQPKSSTSIDPYLPENQTITISPTKVSYLYLRSG
ncbi:uncharacterized protein LOC134684610 [Mytilus trossulus]|uniref:uncharacterized protein LOC134684610 n=1 Tax=Mytilus trossulus TaxID=6551 RepID=UPI00300605B7